MIFFVQRSDSWQTQHTHKKRVQTEAFSQSSIDESGEVQKSVKQLISPWVFFGLLLTAFGILWLEGRVG